MNCQTFHKYTCMRVKLHHHHDRERETEKQTDGQTDRQTDRKTDRDRKEARHQQRDPTINTASLPPQAASASDCWRTWGGPVQGWFQIPMVLSVWSSTQPGNTQNSTIVSTSWYMQYDLSQLWGTQNTTSATWWYTEYYVSPVCDMLNTQKTSVNLVLHKILN